MGSLATKPATQHELAEATGEPSSGRPQPHSMATTTPVGAARSAAPPAAASIVIYTDLEKAVDKVPHKRLISKLYSYGINQDVGPST